MNMTSLTKTMSNGREVDLKDQEFKEKLMNNIKKQVKQIMEEAVTKKFVHEGSTSVLSLCASVEACLSHGLKRRVLGLFKSSSTAALLQKIAKTFDPAYIVAKIVNDIENANIGRSSSSGDSSAKIKPHLQKSESISQINHKFLWIKVALFQKQLSKIIDYLVQHASKYYEKDALISDPDYGPIISSLLVGPCALDYSKLKTQDHFWTDPPADELVQRHRISSGYFIPSTPNTPPNLKRPGLNYRRGISTSASEDSTRPLSMSARDYVESLHQNNKATLLYGKNNVLVQPTPDVEPLAGYLSLHQCNSLLTIKWTPNQLMNGCCENPSTSDPGLDKRKGSDISIYSTDSNKFRKPQLVRQCSLPPSHPPPLQRFPSFIRRFSQDALYPCFTYWQYALNVQLQDVVYLHCHQEGDSCGTLVLVGQDGVQRPPIKFPVGGHLLAFLSCLEAGLLPHGQLDPPLWSQRGKGKVFPKYKKKGLTDDEDETSDFVFRIVYTSKPTSMKSELLEMTMPKSPRSPRFTPRLSSSTHTSSTSSSKSLSLSECFSFANSNGVSEGSLQLVCDTMKKQIISRAFYGWLAYCRHLRTVRTHLSGLVHSQVVSPEDPTDARCGVTTDVWKNLHNKDRLISGEELCRYTYFGGIDPTLRREVWPYLLNHYSINSSQEERDEVDRNIQCHYETTMSEWLAVEAIVSYRDKEATAANIAKLSSGSSCEAGTLPQGIAVSNEVFEDCDDLSDLSADTPPNLDIEIAQQEQESQLTQELENTIIVTRASNSDSDLPVSGCGRDNILNCDDNDDSLSVSPASSQGGVYSVELLESFGLNLHRIDKDVQRCDRNYCYFTPPENLEKLRNVMCTYVWENLEMGYVQGMCDLVAPLLVIFDDEAKTYSCFSHLMKRMAANFPHGGAMDNFFANMRSLIQILDSEMFELMHQNGDYTHFYFCYRWFLLDFKRELVYDDVFSVWECIWAAAQLCSANFVLFIALALVQFYRDIILDNNMDFTDIIKFFNEMAERHDAKAILQMARDLVTQLQALIDNK